MKLITVSLLLSSTFIASAAAQEMKWTPRPSFRIGEALRLDPRVKLQGDFRWFPDEAEPRDGTFAMARRRLSVEGTLFKRVDFEIEREFGAGGLWTDVYADFRLTPQVQLMAGKFKMPFSLEELTSAFALDFIYRSVIGRDLAPGRDIGANLHGRVLQEAAALSYDAGVFRHDGERSRFLDNPGAGTSFAGRLRLQPLRTMDAWLQPLQVGVSSVTGEVPEGRNSLRGRVLAGQSILYRVYVNGRRTRLGADLALEPGPFSIRAEVTRIREARLGQGSAGEDLPALETGGWYLAGAWVLTGERKGGGVQPARPLTAGGFGAVELAARYERVGSGSDDPAAPESDDPRAANLVEVGSGATTLGVNWYLHRWARIQFNAIRESFDDPARSPVPGRSSFWIGVCRLQLAI